MKVILELRLRTALYAQFKKKFVSLAAADVSERGIFLNMAIIAKPVVLTFCKPVRRKFP